MFRIAILASVLLLGSGGRAHADNYAWDPAHKQYVPVDDSGRRVTRTRMPRGLIKLGVFGVAAVGGWIFKKSRE